MFVSVLVQAACEAVAAGGLRGHHPGAGDAADTGEKQAGYDGYGRAFAEPMHVGCMRLADGRVRTMLPTRAKALNMFASEVAYLADSIIEHDGESSAVGIDPSSQH